MDFVFLSRKKLLIILESQILPFKEIFKKKIFRIPDYQRGYSWEQTQLEDLWADLSNIHLHAYHFTGILTINNFSEQDYESLEREGFQNLVNREQGVVAINGEFYTPHNLVDGQQRLTTILILLSQLIKKIKNEAERLQFSRQYFFMYDNGNKYLFGYHVDVPSHHYLIRDIFEDDSYSVEDTETLYTHNLDFAKDFFNKKIVRGEYMMRNTNVTGGSASLALAGAKDTRVELRTSADIKEKLKEAASLVGVDMSAFILMAATRAAQQALDEQRMRVLSEQEWNHLNDIINSPRQPGEKLRALMTRETRYVRDY